MAAGLIASRRPLRWAAVRASAPAGLLFALNLLLFFSAIKQTGVADVLIIGALQPVLVLLLAGRLFGERVTARELVFMAASVCGVGLFILGSSGTPVWSLGGDTLAAGSLLVFTAYFLVSKRVRRVVGALEYMTTVTIVAALVVTPIALVSGDRLGGLRIQDWLWLTVFVCAAQGGHLLLAWAQAHVDVTLSSLLLLGETPISAVAALFVLGEPITALGVVGGLVAIASLGAVVRRITFAAEALDAQAETALP
jgi:drug/metabolite transporter (DMT)-like permease